MFQDVRLWWLGKKIRHNNQHMRATAAKALGEIRDSRAIHLLIDLLLRDVAPEVRKEAAVALGEINDPYGLPTLMVALADKDNDVKAAAARALGKLRNPRAIDSLIAILKLKDTATIVVDASAAALAEIGDNRAVAALIAIVEDKDSRVLVLVNAARALGIIRNPKAIGPLIERLADWWEVRDAAFEALGSIRHDWIKSDEALRAMPQFIDRLRHPDAPFEIIVEALNRIAPEWRNSDAARSTVPELIVTLKDKVPKVRGAAARMLGEIQDRQAVPPLLAVLGDSDLGVQKAVFVALGKIGDASAVVAMLNTNIPQCEHDDERQMSYPNQAGFAAMAEALGRIGDPVGVQWLLRWLGYGDRIYSANCHEILPHVLTSLCKILETRVTDVQLDQLEVMAKLYPYENNPYRRVLDEKKNRIRELARAELSRRGHSYISCPSCSHYAEHQFVRKCRSCGAFYCNECGKYDSWKGIYCPLCGSPLT